MIRKRLRNVFGKEFTESNYKYAKINFAIILAMFIVSAVMVFILPKEISIIHTGDTYYPIPSILGVWLAPIIGIILNLTFIKQNRLSALNSMVMGILFVFTTGYYFTLM